MTPVFVFLCQLWETEEASESLHAVLCTDC